MSSVDALEYEYYLFAHSADEYSRIKDKVEKQQLFIESLEAIIAGKSKRYVSNLQSQAREEGISFTETHPSSTDNK